MDFIFLIVVVFLLFLGIIVWFFNGVEKDNRESLQQGIFIGFLYMGAFLLAMVGLDNNKMSLNYTILAGSALIAAAILHAKERDLNGRK